MGIRIDSGNALFIGSVLWIVIRCLVLLINKRYKRFSLKREFLLSVFVVYLIGVISVTLFPIEIIWGDAPQTYRISRPVVNIIPLVDIIPDFSRTHFSMAFKIKFLVKNLVGNLTLLLPLGLLLPILWSKARSFWKIVIIGASVSLSIELLQFILAYLGFGWGRVTDIDDLILNILGVILGYVIFDKVLVHFNKGISGTKEELNVAAKSFSEL
jgi:glycopeptide antibiotics resistance protein